MIQQAQSMQPAARQPDTLWGEWIEHRLLNVLRLTRNEAAYQAGVTERTLSRWFQSGSMPQMHNPDLLARVLKVPVHSLADIHQGSRGPRDWPVEPQDVAEPCDERELRRVIKGICDFLPLTELTRLHTVAIRCGRRALRR